MSGGDNILCVTENEIIISDHKKRVETFPKSKLGDNVKPEEGKLDEIETKKTEFLT